MIKIVKSIITPEIKSNYLLYFPRFITKWDYLIMGCEFVFSTFLTYYLVEELIEMQKMRLEYFR